MARISYCHHIGRDIFGYDRSCTDGYVVSDCDSGKDSDAAANPYIVADGNRFSPLVACVPFDWVSAMAGCIDTYVRSDETVITDSYFCLVKDRKVEIGKETLADANLFAVIAIEWLIDDDLVISDVSKQTF